jgi:hypothetical protein
MAMKSWDNIAPAQSLEAEPEKVAEGFSIGSKLGPPNI